MSHRPKGTLISVQNAASLAKEASALIADALVEAQVQRGVAFLGLSGGSTPLATYEALACDPRIPWSKVHVFWVDDRAVPPTHERSNYAAANRSLLRRTSIPSSHVHRLRGEADNLDEAAREMETCLRQVLSVSSAQEVPRLDVLVMGIGDDAHTASLFPGDGTVHERSRLFLAVPASEGREARLTMTAPLLQEARQLVVLVQGASKKKALEQVWAPEGSEDEAPARVLEAAKGNVTWIVGTESLPA